MNNFFSFKKIIFYIIVLLSLSFCYFYIINIDNDKPDNSQIINQINMYISKKEDITIIRDYLDMHLKYLSLEESNDIMIELISYLNSQAIKLNEFEGILLNDLDKYNTLDLSDYSNIVKLPKGIIQGLFSEAENNFLKAIKVGNYYTFYVDTDLISKKYSKYIKKDFAEYINFITDVNLSPSYNSSTHEINLELCAQRIVWIENTLKEFANSAYYDSWISSLESEYKVLLGLSHSEFFEVDNGTYYSADIVSCYENLANKYKNSNLELVLKKAIALIKSKNRKIDDDMISELHTYYKIKN